jgi:protein O-GlcNAc transferase
MDPMTLKLASLRLAPVQVAAWGHPETTGLPTIDYYLSAEAFEPPQYHANYMETPMALPNLGCCYTPLPVASVEPDLAHLSIGSDRAILICPGAPFKYAPQFDFIFVEIARRLGKCRLVFFTWQIPALSETLRRRLEARFSESNLRFSDYGVFVPWQPTAQFYGLMKRADVFLDTIGFSGFNTAMQAVECNLPIVTMDGKFMRGRLASGILKRMNMHELIVEKTGDYIQVAVRLAEDKDYARQIRRRMLAAEGVLYEDVSAVRALEHALVAMLG